MATTTTELLKEYNINAIEWLPKAVDLSPIENCFGEI
jgi:hypothetical protein